MKYSSAEEQQLKIVPISSLKFIIHALIFTFFLNFPDAESHCCFVGAFLFVFHPVTSDFKGSKGSGGLWQPVRSNARYFCYQLPGFSKNPSVCGTRRRSGVFYLSDTTNVDIISFSVKMFLADIITSRAGSGIISFISALIFARMLRMLDRK